MEERLYEIFNKYNSDVLKLFGSTIGKFESLTPSQAHKLAQQLKNGRDINQIINELVKLSNLSKKEVINILENTAKDNIEFAKPYYEYRGITQTYAESKQFQEIVKSVGKITNDTFSNIARTTCIKLLDDKGKPKYLNIKKAYNEVIDRAVLAVTTGQQDYQSAMRDTIKQLADSGVKKVYYENKKPYARRLDSTIRQNVLEGIRQVNNGIQEQIGDEIGANGIEISVHSNCAIDHQDIQGKQYTTKEFEKLNNKLDRPISTLNCYHTTFSVILGVQESLYTKKELQQIKNESNEKFVFDGKEYSKYEGTQLQRNIELRVRQYKDNQIIARASGNMEEVARCQKNISLLTRKYNELSNISGLPTRKQRMSVSGYQRVATNKK